MEQKAHFFALDLPHRDACFVRACPAAVSEAWIDGHVHAFAVFGRGPQSVLYDNDRCLVAKILPGGTRKRIKLFSGFLSHHVIHDRHGRPGKGNDKGAVEGLVGYARRHFMVPIPRFPTGAALNLWRAEKCRKRQADILRGQVLRVLETFEMADLPVAIKNALRMGAIGFDAVKHLVPCQIEQRPPRPDLDVYPYLPKPNVGTTSAASYLSLMRGRAA